VKDEYIPKLFKSFGLGREYWLYLRAFKKTRPHQFAVIKISGGTLAEKAQIVAEDLAFLSKLGLCPIVVHGGGRQIDSALAKKGLKSKKAAGARVTDEASMEIVAKVLGRLTASLVKSVNANGGKAVDANPLHLVSAVKAARVKGTDLGLVGRVESVDANRLRSICEAGGIPILASIGWSAGGPLNINADALAKEIVLRVQPRKFILVTEAGGVMDKAGNLISEIDVQSDLPNLAANGTVDGGMLLKLEEMKCLLEMARPTVVEICSAESLLEELFTVKGSGTFIRRGANFAVSRAFDGLNTRRITALLEASFGKKLVPGYFSHPVESVILERNYDAIAVVKKVRGFPYLDKFSVAKGAQGNGLGKALWREVQKLYPRLVWRASQDNAVNSWYFKNCCGCQRNGGWIVFWRNVGPSKALGVVSAVASLPPTLVRK